MNASCSAVRSPTRGCEDRLGDGGHQAGAWGRLRSGVAGVATRFRGTDSMETYSMAGLALLISTIRGVLGGKRLVILKPSMVNGDWTDQTNKQ